MGACSCRSSNFPPFLKNPELKPEPSFELQKFLANSTHSQSLDLSNRKCSHMDLEESLIPILCASPLRLPLVDSSSWRLLNLKNNSLSHHTICKLAQSLSDPTTNSIHSVYLHGNDCGDAGALALSHAIKSNSKLKILGLDSNNISDVGVENLANALPESKLEWLFLNKNPITDSGVHALCVHVDKSNLKALALQHTLISAEGGLELVNTVQHTTGNRQLVAILVDPEAVSMPHFVRLKHVLQLNQSMWLDVTTTLLSVHTLPHLGLSSNLRCLPVSLLHRLVREFLPFDSKKKPCPRNFDELENDHT